MTGRGASRKLASFNPRRLGIRILVRWFDAPLQIFVLLSQLCDPSLPLLLSFFDSMTVRLLQFSCHPLPLRNNVHHRHIPLRVFQGVGAFDLQPSVRTPLGVTIALALASFQPRVVLPFSPPQTPSSRTPRMPRTAPPPLPPAAYRRSI